MVIIWINLVDPESPMLYTKIQSQFLVLEKKILKYFYHIWAPQFNGAKSFEQIVKTLSTEGSMWNLVKIDQADSEKTFEIYTILYMYIANGQGQITPRGQNFDCK